MALHERFHDGTALGFEFAALDKDVGERAL